ncbi:hypothetical protein IEQ34_012690 [Dendrobium chrysotoxum]|uniref:RING-type E3 ubiquitin transferase n=1 Tax=Dendrobium chrysotoxum TaxID=161865 RepID=A0AAV7GMG9_DENCH|nr:hypothetical protein IEQ34_012690 [Dendrobium chrysotoxum]
MAAPARSLEYEFEWAPSPAATATTAAISDGKRAASKIIDNLSPPLIAMFAVIGTAFLIVVYARLLSRQISRLRRRWRRWRRCRHLLRSAASDFGTGSQSHFSPPPYPAPFPFSSDSYSDHLLSPYGLDDAAIKTLPLSLFSRSKAKQPISTNRDCAVCLFEFDDGEWLRTLPICGHAFHIECIDVWLRSHPTCPLCRAAVSFRSDSPFVPMRAARIRPSFDDIVVDPPAPPDPASSPILEERGRGFLLKRSYSFGFERSVGTERVVMEVTAATTASPAWRLRHQHHSQHHQHRGFWSKRWPSPFGGGGSARPYYHRSGGGGVMKSPFCRRWGFVPFNAAGGVGAAGSSATTTGTGGRRSRSMTSPSAMWMGRAVGFSSSRMRCGDPEALLSPERFNRR